MLTLIATIMRWLQMRYLNKLADQYALSIYLRRQHEKTIRYLPSANREYRDYLFLSVNEKTCWYTILMIGKDKCLYEIYTVKGNEGDNTLKRLREKNYRSEVIRNDDYDCFNQFSHRKNLKKLNAYLQQEIKYVWMDTDRRSREAIREYTQMIMPGIYNNQEMKEAKKKFYHALHSIRITDLRNRFIKTGMEHLPTWRKTWFIRKMK